MAVCTTSVLQAIDPNRTVSQYFRQRWGTEQGFPPGPVYSIGQTKDGYLWIGTEKGLVRFDGLSFHLIQSAAPEQPSLSHVLGLIGDAEGSLWLRLRHPGLTLLRYHNGIFRNPMGDLATRSSVSAMTRGRDGNILFCFSEGREANAVVLRDQRFEKLVSPADLSRTTVLAIAQTSNGDLWAGTSGAGLFRVRDGRAFAVTQGLPDLKVNTLVPAGNELWVGTDGGLVRWDGTKLTKDEVTRSLDGVQILAMTSDRNSNLWAGTNSRGLLRLNAKGISWMDGTEKRGREAVTALFEDREGNLWAGSAGSLEQIRDSVFVTYSSAEGLPSDSAGPIYLDPENSAWVAPISGGLSRLREGRAEDVPVPGLGKDVVYSIAGDKDGLWLGRQRGGLTHLRRQGRSFIPTTYTTGQGLAQNSVYAVNVSRDGAIWAGTLTGGVSRLHGGKFTTYTRTSGLASNTVVSILEASAGDMWFATPDGLSALSRGHWRTYKTGDGLPSDSVNCLLEDSAGVLWIGTSSGLAFRNDGRIQSPAATPASLREEILGIAEDRKASLWIATATHVLRVNRNGLLNGRLTAEDLREYSIVDGLRSADGVKRHKSVVTDSLGRVWFSLNRGISVVDPELLAGSSAPALVSIQSISADGHPINKQGAVRIPGGSKRVVIGYAGLSLSVPERVRFRYLLEAFDPDWSQPVSVREAVYTNLGPGAYRFRVIASNPDGVWNRAETTIGFEIAPLIWQTWWFRLAVTLAVALAITGLYRLHLHQFTKQMNIRFEERLLERTRIARELHDTLLQSFQGVLLKFHAVTFALPDRSDARKKLESAIEEARQAIAEGRDAVQGLRASTVLTEDLARAISTLGEGLAANQNGRPAPDFRVRVEGTPRKLAPILRDEVYRIAGEALRNAFRHAAAERIEVDIHYGKRELRVRAWDNGTGIDPKILDAGGRAGHHGLAGMHERAKVIGGKLAVYSRVDSGTEIELTIPAALAYARSTTAGESPLSTEK